MEINTIIIAIPTGARVVHPNIEIGPGTAEGEIIPTSGT